MNNLSRLPARLFLFAKRHRVRVIARLSRVMSAVSTRLIRISPPSCRDRGGWLELEGLADFDKCGRSELD